VRLKGGAPLSRDAYASNQQFSANPIAPDSVVPEEVVTVSCTHRGPLSTKPPENQVEADEHGWIVTLGGSFWMSLLSCDRIDRGTYHRAADEPPP
jgi:hypothetical protein